MSNKKITHYNLENIEKEDASFNLIWGEKGNGKSYQVKHKRAILKYRKTGKRFIYLRRWKEEITTEKVEQYFADVDVVKITGGEYNCIICYRRRLYFANFDNETYKAKRGEHIGYVMALSTEQNYSGCSYLDVEDIIFEEFMSRNEYIKDEASKLMFLYSTVDRKRHKVKVWLAGNTVSRVCPYIQDWDIQKIISEQKQGTIVTKMIKVGVDEDTGEDIMVKLAIEYCKSTGRSSYVFGKAASMINQGDWQTDPQPHLPKSYKDYKVLFRFIFFYKSFKFLCEYLVDKETNDVCWFIKPYKGIIKENTIVFSDVIKISPYWQRDIYNTTFDNEDLNNLFKTFRENIIFYASDLAGTDFKQVIDFIIKK
jgi:energy-coupling factor transporter ATP-binding protein EcfA2